MALKNGILLAFILSLLPTLVMAQPQEVIDAHRLHNTIKAGDVQKVKESIQKDIDVNFQYNGRNALHAACKTGSAEMVELILNAGADVNSISDEGKGLTSLQWVTWGFGMEKSIEVIRLLLEHGADPNLAQNNYKYPLFYAIENKDVEVVKLLVDNGAKLDIKNDSGQTPLEYTQAQLSEKSTDSDSRKILEQIKSLLAEESSS